MRRAAVVVGLLALAVAVVIWISERHRRGQIACAAVATALEGSRPFRATPAECQVDFLSATGWTISDAERMDWIVDMEKLSSELMELEDRKLSREERLATPRGRDYSMYLDKRARLAAALRNGDIREAENIIGLNRR